jgi:hypothetical protein
MSRAAALRTSNRVSIGPVSHMSPVADRGSDVPVPPPTAFHCATRSRTTSAITQVPIAK